MNVDEFQSRLDAVMIHLNVENQDHDLEIRFLGHCDEHHWKVDVSWYEDSDVDDTESRSFWSIQHVSFTGVTLADAVDAAWEHYGHPFMCPECHGEGTFWWHDDDIPTGVPGLSVRVYSDGHQAAHKDCPTCDSARILFPATVPS